MGNKIHVTVTNNTGQNLSIHGPEHYDKALVIGPGKKMTTSYKGREWSFHLVLASPGSLSSIKKTLYSGNFILNNTGMYTSDGKKCGEWTFTYGLAGAAYKAKPPS